ncbi:PadR family transcriptional regulator [Actinoplanes sp. NPDC049599]|uniref:PadR family transcriptional regulator n=1 Tax=Actinoplanes sp. NPDC049599 TaxID=3363903 RepID=UPI003794B77F
MMTSPFVLAVVRCRHPQACPAEQLISNDGFEIAGRLRALGWTQHRDHGWICPQHAGREDGCVARRRKVVMTHRTRALIQAIRDGHDFGMAIMRETGLSESTVYATLRRLRAAGWTVCELEPAEVAVRRQRPQRKIYRLTEGLLEELGWPR